jgi:hypothetical protein
MDWIFSEHVTQAIRKAIKNGTPWSSNASKVCYIMSCERPLKNSARGEAIQ